MDNDNERSNFGQWMCYEEGREVEAEAQEIMKLIIKIRKKINIYNSHCYYWRDVRDGNLFDNVSTKVNELDYELSKIREMRYEALTDYIKLRKVLFQDE